MHEDNFRPTPQGIALAKDVWMMGIALGLIVDDLGDRPDKGEPG